MDKSEGLSNPQIVEWWINGADENIVTARRMVKTREFLWCGFVCHLAAEKALKAVIQSGVCG